MNRLQDIAELLVASWVLSADKDVDPLPASTYGVLDRALQQALEHDAFPSDWKTRLHFVCSVTGIQCVELDDIIGAAQRAEFTQEPNPSYRATKIKISPHAANALVRRHEFDADKVRQWGVVLRTSVKDALATMKDFTPVNAPT